MYTSTATIKKKRILSLRFSKVISYAVSRVNTKTHIIYSYSLLFHDYHDSTSLYFKPFFLVFFLAFGRMTKIISISAYC